MSDTQRRYSGGCLCGALRYEAEGEPTVMGHCYCADCRKVSGAGFIPPVCGGLVFGGSVATDDSFTIYAGSLDDPSLFRPRIAIFTRGRPEWALIPAGLRIYDGLPG
jgi:hypothetical protein